MHDLQSRFISRLPQTGTTIFTRMSALASASNAINLGQGFPDFDCDPGLAAHVTQAMQEGHNQYPPMAGVPALRQVISRKIETLYGHHYDAETEITVTAGATQGLFTAISTCVRPGDEVVVIEPAYDSYAPAITLAGGVMVPVKLDVAQGCEGISYRIPFERLAQALTPRTRLIIINTPHNPTGTIWREDDMLRLARMLDGTQILVCADEVYEHMVYDGEIHASVSRYPALAERSIVISSFGKSFHVTGWKVGYAAAPAWLMREFRKLHQYTVFTVNPPMQHAIARYMANPAPYLELPAFYQEKRDYFRAGLAGTKFKLLASEGTYFQCVDYTGLGIPEATLGEASFAEFLTREIGVAAIPISAFYHDATESGVVRFCFAKRRETLDMALERLGRL